MAGHVLIMNLMIWIDDKNNITSEVIVFVMLI